MANVVSSQAARFLLEHEEAARIVDELEAQVRTQWHRIARKGGVRERDCKKIARAFVYEGFRHPA